MLRNSICNSVCLSWFVCQVRSGLTPGTPGTVTPVPVSSGCVDTSPTCPVYAQLGQCEGAAGASVRAQYAQHQHCSLNRLNLGRGSATMSSRDMPEMPQVSTELLCVWRLCSSRGACANSLHSIHACAYTFAVIRCRPNTRIRQV